MCKGISQIFSFHSTYLSMGNCKMYAILMIGDMILVTMTMMMIWWCFFSVLETRQRFTGIAHCLSLQAFNNKELFCCAAGFWRHPRLPGRADKKQTFRKRLRNTWRPRGKIKRNSLKHTVSKNSVKDDSWASKRENYFFLKNNVWLNIFNKKKDCNKSEWTFKYSWKS